MDEDVTKHSGGFWSHVWYHLREQRLNVFFLVALATLVHEFHFYELFRPWTPQSMRIVHWVEQRFVDWAGKQVGAPQGEPQVTLLLVPPDAHLQMFCGLTPTPRGQLAEALTTIANVIKEQMCTTQPRPVIGIDVDVAPVTQRSLWVEQCGSYRSNEMLEALAADKTAKMKQALGRLACFADIVAITTPRSSDEEREDRKKWLEANLGEGMRIEIATPLEWFDVGEPDYRFLKSNDSEPYPSLGNLMGRAANPAASAASTPTFDKEALESARAACLAASAASTPAFDKRVLEFARAASSAASAASMPALKVLDFVDGSRAGQLPEEYEWAYLDLLRGSVRVSVRLISSFDDLGAAVSDWAAHFKDENQKCVPAPQSSGKARPMLLLALDDGSSDKHFSVMDTHTMSSGSYLQAVRAVSFNEPLAPQVHEQLWKGALLDFVIGWCYVFLWSVATFFFGLVAGRGWLFAAATLTFIGPLAITGFLGFFAALLAARLLSVGQWFEPLLIFFFLTVHAYMTVWELTAEPAIKRTPRRSDADRLLSLGWRWLRMGTVLVVAVGILALATRVVVYCGHHGAVSDGNCPSAFGYCVHCPSIASPKGVGS
jgi:hypothetical protein